MRTQRHKNVMEEPDEHNSESVIFDEPPSLTKIHARLPIIGWFLFATTPRAQPEIHCSPGPGSREVGAASSRGGPAPFRDRFGSSQKRARQTPLIAVVRFRLASYCPSSCLWPFSSPPQNIHPPCAGPASAPHPALPSPAIAPLESSKRLPEDRAPVQQLSGCESLGSSGCGARSRQDGRCRPQGGRPSRKLF